MIDYAGIANVVGAFPNVVAQNASGAGATDGTPYIASFIDDLWGHRQALMSLAGLTPNAVTEAVGASQAIDAMYRILGGGPGTGVIWWKNSDPATTGDRVLLLTGQTIVRANYPALDAAVYVGDANNAAVAAAGGAFYRSSDAGGVTPSTTGAYLVLPDTRGRVLRGWDTGATVDPQGATRKIGSKQADAFQGHHHSLIAKISIPGFTGGSGDLALSNLSGTDTGGGRVINPVTDGTNGTPRTTSETRMANVQTRYGIIY